MSCKTKDCIPCRLFATDINDIICPICNKELEHVGMSIYACEGYDDHYFDIFKYDRQYPNQIIFGFPKLFEIWGNKPSFVRINNNSTLDFIYKKIPIILQYHKYDLIHWGKIGELENFITKLVTFQ